MKMTRLFAILMFVTFVAGCAASGMKDVTKSGFLVDYSKLKAGGEDRAALVYIKEGANFKRYDKVMFDRVAIMLSDKAEYKVVDPAVMNEFTTYYQTALINAIKGGYQLVDKPGPGVLRVRAAITGVKPSKPTANTLSTILPVGWITSGATKAVSGDNMGTGEAATEIDVLDSLTGQRLAAAVDRRQGGKSAFRGKWVDTKNAFDFWAKRFRERLDEARGM